MSTRKEYIEKMKASLDRLDAEIGKLEKRADNLTAEAKAGYQKQLQQMQSYRNEAEAKVKELQKASDEAWKDMRTGFDKAWGDIMRSFETAISRFKD